MSDADILTRLELNAKQFSQGLDTALRDAEGKITTSTARLNAEMNSFAGVAGRSAREVVQTYGKQVAAVGNASTQLARAGDVATAAARQQRAAYQQLGFQMSDVVAQASNGTNAFVILAQQGGQTAMAMAGLGGTLGRVAGFLSGPWGAAVFGAVTVIGLLATRTGEAAKKQEEAADQFDAARLASIDLGTAIKELNTLTGKNVLTMEQQIGALKAVAEAKRQDAIATRQQIQAELDRQSAALKAAQLTARQSESRGDGGGGFRAGLGAGIAVRAAAIQDLQRQRDDQDVLIAQAEQAAAAAERKLQSIRTEEAKKGAKERDKVERSARQTAEREMREAERTRADALERENDLLRLQGDRVREIAEMTARLRGNFGEQFDRRLGTISGAFNPQSNITTDVGPSVLQDIAQREIGKAFSGTTDRFRQEGIVAAQAIAQAFGGKVGGEVNKIAGVMRGLSSGDFTSVGGPVGGAATLLARDPATRRALKETFEPLTSEFSKTFDGISKSLGLKGGGELLGSAVAGFGIGTALGGNLESGIGGAIGSTAGKALGKAVGGPIGGAIGSLLGGIVGSGIGGLFAAPKKGSVTLGASGGVATVGAASGNSASRRSAATSIGGSVADQLNSIADIFGGSVGSFAVSVGQRDGVFSVDPTGRGYVSKKYGAQQFSSAEEAARFAIRDAINDGALTGVSQTIVNAIQNASSLEKGLADAQAIQSIGQRLREIEDPIGASLSAIADQFDDLRETLLAAGASAQELAELEKLRTLETEAVLKSALSTLTGFRDSLLVGGASPLSLTDQRRNAELAFAKFEGDIAAGRTIDQSAFVEAGRNLLDVDRQISGGTQDYFATFSRVQAATGGAISGLQSAAAIRESELAAAARSTADATAELVNLGIEQNALLARVEQLLAASGYGFVGADAAGRGFTRAA